MDDKTPKKLLIKLPDAKRAQLAYKISKLSGPVTLTIEDRVLYNRLVVEGQEKVRETYRDGLD